jgi:hypothetical protein
LETKAEADNDIETQENVDLLSRRGVSDDDEGGGGGGYGPSPAGSGGFG